MNYIIELFTKPAYLISMAEWFLIALIVIAVLSIVVVVFWIVALIIDYIKRNKRGK